MAVNQIDPSAQRRMQGLSPIACRLLTEAGKAVASMQPDVAERALIGVLAMAPGSPEANRLMGIVSQMQGNYAHAIDFLRKAQSSCPDDATILMNLGISLYDIGCVEESLATLKRACEAAPDLASAWYNLGKALRLQAAIADACTALQKALAIDPKHIMARLCLADSQTNVGEISQAVANYRELLRLQPSNHDAWYALANLKTVRFNKDDTARLQHLLRQTTLKTDARISIGFTLAKALEDQGSYLDAFDALSKANALKRRHVHWDTAAHRDHVDAIINAFSKPYSASLDPNLGQEVIFIVGVPRSGSTLIEQILASHPQVEGANEITDLPQVIEEESIRRGKSFPHWIASATPEDWFRLGEDYLNRTKRWRENRPRFTDKNLITWELVGAIVQMLPGARFINSRRDPLETCFACYRQLFSNGAHFSYNLEEMAEYHLSYDRLITHWQRLFSDRIFTHNYEALLADTEMQIRQLLAFCDLEFDPSCMAFYQTSRTVFSTASAAQVRQPLRADISRLALYGDKLDALRWRLSGHELTDAN